MFKDSHIMRKNIPIILFGNAVVDPIAMMIKITYTSLGIRLENFSPELSEIPITRSTMLTILVDACPAIIALK